MQTNWFGGGVACSRSAFRVQDVWASGVNSKPGCTGTFKFPPWTADIRACAFFLPENLGSKLESLNQKGAAEADSLAVLDECWATLDREGILQPGSRGSLLPGVTGKEPRTGCGDRRLILRGKRVSGGLLNS